METRSGKQAPSRRRRRSSVTEQILETAKQVESKVGRTLLLLWDELPHWRQDNAFIRGGYRPTSNSYLSSFGSLAYLHNESVNIWSHLAGAAAFFTGAGLLHRTVVAAPRYSGASAADVVVFACFFAGACLCLGMSAAYHALCNHSPAVAKWGNKLDYSGIVCLIVGSFVPALYYGFACLPGLMALYLYGILSLGLGCLAVSWLEHFRTPRWRPYRAMMFVGLGTSAVVPVLHGLTIYGYRELNERMGLDWVLLQGFLYIAGAFLYAIRWPECKSPGKFDICGSSHQIFHIFILFAAAAHLRGMAKAFDFHHGAMGSRC